MAYTTIKKPSDYFNTVLYTGNGSTNAITGVGFAPDLTLLKDRNDTSGTRSYDTVRGAIKRIRTDTNEAEVDDSDGLTAFGSDGFTLGADGATNANGTLYVSWNWLGANGTASNTDGSITSTVSANTTNGFSIVSYTGTGSAGTIGHGLGSTPKMIIVKCRSDADTWAGYHTDVGATKYMELDTTAAAQTSTQPWNDTEPTSSVFTVGNWSATNGSSRTYIAYCFAEKKGFSKFGSYTGNFSTDGTFVYCGFKPAFIMAKAYSRAEDWYIFDNKRLGYNPDNEQLYANSSTTEGTLDYIDILSNGFKLRQANYGLNGPSETYIYMAFAESPLVGTNNTPATAR